MPVDELNNFRQKYPQYNDISDIDLANKLASKYSSYSDLPNKVLESSKNQNRLQLKDQSNASYSYGDALSDTGKTVINSFANLGDNITQPIRHPIQTAGAIASGVGNAIIHPVNTVKGIVNNITSTNNPDNVPNWAYVAHTDPLKFAGDIVSTGAGIEGAIGLSKGISNIAKNISPTLDKRIFNDFNKAINPRVGQFKQAYQLENYKNNVVKAVKTIDENSPNLNLENPDTGEILNLPNNKQTFLDAIGQTKSQLWNKISNMSQSSTQTGAIVDVPLVANNSLDKLINNKSIKTIRPDIVKEANALKTRLINSGKLSPVETEDLLKVMNHELGKYYSLGDKNAVNIYADVASSLRKELDSTIENSLSKAGYQDLRNQYSSLKSIESDVLRSAAKKTIASDLSLGGQLLNVSAGEEIIRGIITQNPGAIVSGAGIKSYQIIRKYLRSPDMRIKRMFNYVSKSHP